jgi:HlyD family secretion protein
MSDRPIWNIRRSVRWHMLFSAVATGTLFGAVGGWAASTELSGAILAPGVLVVDSSVKKVQHPTGGVVGELRVREGDSVKAGEVLARLDETVTRANLAIIERSLLELAARQARLEAERDGSDRPSHSADVLSQSQQAHEVEKIIAGENKLFELRWLGRSGQKNQLRERTNQIKDEIQGLTGQLSGKKREIELIGQELGGVRELWQKNLISIQRVTALERDAARLEGEHGQLLASVAQAKGKISEIELQIIQIDQDLRAEVAKELRDVQAKMAELVEKRVAAQDQLRRVDIRSPQDGLVHQLAVHTIGGVIAAGEVIMAIVPNADKLVVEARVSPREIDQIKTGQSAQMRLVAFNQNATPQIAGRVQMVAADQTNDDKTGASYFKINVAPDTLEISRLRGVKLVPGMPIEVFLQTSPRTVLSYLMKPISDQVSRVFKEE